MLVDWAKTSWVEASAEHNAEAMGMADTEDVAGNVALARFVILVLHPPSVTFTANRLRQPTIFTCAIGPNRLAILTVFSSPETSNYFSFAPV